MSLGRDVMSILGDIAFHKAGSPKAGCYCLTEMKPVDNTEVRSIQTLLQPHF
jgi:hypothetical protein